MDYDLMSSPFIIYQPFFINQSNAFITNNAFQLILTTSYLFMILFIAAGGAPEPLHSSSSVPPSEVTLYSTIRTVLISYRVCMMSHYTCHAFR